MLSTINKGVINIIILLLSIFR